MCRYALFLFAGAWSCGAGIGLAQPPAIIGQAEKKAPNQGIVRVGEIMIVGAKDDKAIRDALQLFPSQPLDDLALRKAKMNLKGFDATIKVIDTDKSNFKNILVTVKSKVEVPEELIVEALKNNPDIGVAESKVREADAELSRTRLKVISDVTAMHGDVMAAHAAVTYQELECKRAKVLLDQKVFDQGTFDQQAQLLEKVKASLAAKQARLPYLLGAPSGTARKKDDEAKALESLIAEALKNNPDIRVASSKAHEAAAELNRTRLKVASDITNLQTEILERLGNPQPLLRKLLF